MPSSRYLFYSCGIAGAVVWCLVAAVATAIDVPPPSDAQAAVLVAAGIPDDFDPVRQAVAEVSQQAEGDYRVVVVKSSGGDGSAGVLLPQLVNQWWEARGEGGGYNPSTDVTILLDIGDRSIAMDVPPSQLAAAGLDRAGLEKEVIGKVFVPRARDMDYATGLAELVRATRQTITDRTAAKAKRAEAIKIFTTRTLPAAAVGLVALGGLVWLAAKRVRHAGQKAAARDRLAAFKQEVVALSDLLDAQRERHRMLPHADPDFLTPMTGMTQNAYDAVQEALARYREQWLGLMDVWEKAEARMGEEWFLGTAASDEVIAMLDAAEARPPLEEVAATCRGPLDALEQAHEKAREMAATLDTDLATTRHCLDSLTRRGRSAAPFEPGLARAARDRELGGEALETDPVAARGQFEEARRSIGDLMAGVEAVEGADLRRHLAVERVEEIARHVAARRSEGWLLAEPGGDPDDGLAVARRDATLAAELLDAADVETACMHLVRSEAAAAEAATLLENTFEARSRAESLITSLTARLESLSTGRAAAERDLRVLADRYAKTAWEDLADNLASSAEAAERAQTLLEDGRADSDRTRQCYFRGVAALEEAQRQLDWAATCLEAIVGRRRELDDLAAAIPPLRQKVAGRIDTLATALARQRTDRPRSNERCREAKQLLDAAGRLADDPHPDPRMVEQAIRAAETAAVRGEEFAAEDDRLARQATADLADAEGLFRRASSWYAEGVKADVRGAQLALQEARSLLAQQRYEDSIRRAGEAAEQARLAYAQAAAEAERRRSWRLAEQQRRQLEESFARMARGAGPFVISLPTGGLTGPNPWRSSGSGGGGSGGSGRVAGGGWSRDVAEVRW